MERAARAGVFWRRVKYLIYGAIAGSALVNIYYAGSRAGYDRCDRSRAEIRDLAIQSVNKLRECTETLRYYFSEQPLKEETVTSEAI